MTLHKNSFLYLCLFVSPTSIYAANTTEQSTLAISVESGLGFDNNIYHAPKAAYLDYGKTCTVGTDANCILGDDGLGHIQTIPTIHSSTFIPINFKLRYFKGIDSSNTIETRYQFKGKVYTDNKFNNADQFLHRIDIGNTSLLDSRRQYKSKSYVGFFLGNKKRLYIDRDTGENQQTSTSKKDISARYIYNFLGIEYKYFSRFDDFSFDGKLDYRKRDYQSTAVSEYDNVQIGAAGKVTWRIAKPTKIYSGLEFFSVNYDKRPSRDEVGKLLSKNPKRQYNYTIFNAGVRHRINRQWLVYADVDAKLRVDKYKNYDDYSKLRLKLRLHYRVTAKNKIKLTVSAWQRDYNNAYAFDNFVHGIKKTYSGNGIKLSNIYTLNETTKLTTFYKVKNQESSDLRYIYERSLLSAVVEWQF